MTIAFLANKEMIILSSERDGRGQFARTLQSDTMGVFVILTQVTMLTQSEAVVSKRLFVVNHR